MVFSIIHEFLFFAKIHFLNLGSKYGSTNESYRRMSTVNPLFAVFFIYDTNISINIDYILRCAIYISLFFTIFFFFIRIISTYFVENFENPKVKNIVLIIINTIFFNLFLRFCYQSVTFLFNLSPKIINNIIKASHTFVYCGILLRLIILIFAMQNTTMLSYFLFFFTLHSLFRLVINLGILIKTNPRLKTLIFAEIHNKRDFLTEV